MRRTASGSASPIPSPRRSGRVSRCWPTSAAASSACRCAAPTSTSAAELVRLLGQHHPVDAELVGNHAEARGEEGLAHRHGDLAALAERAEQLLGLLVVGGVDGERKALEVGLAAALAVGGEDLRVADLEGGMHDLVL